jgi:TRAP-type uncharacterized transport system substrate-binding protein
MAPVEDPNSTRPSPPPAPADGRSPLHARLKAQRLLSWEAVSGYWPWLSVAAVLLAVGWLFIKPAPPARVVIATGPADGAYKWFANKYKSTFDANGVTLDVRETAGSVDNYRLLEAEANAGGAVWRDDGVSVAMVQSGTCPDGLKADLKAVASLYLEPVWIFYRGRAGSQLADLRGKRVAVGPAGSGTQSIADRLLGASGIGWVQAAGGGGGAGAATSGTAPSASGDATGPRDSASSIGSTPPSLAWPDPGSPATQPTASGTAASGAPASGAPASGPATRPASGPGAAAPGAPVVFWPQGGRGAADLLKAGKVDAAVFVFSPRHPLAAELLADPAVRLMSFARHEAYARIFPFLSDVTLPRGAVDLGRDLPPNDTFLLAPAANLVVRDGIHPAVVALLIQAATAAHDRGDLLSAPHALPSTRYVEFPVDRAADEYFRHGPPFLQRVLPFRLAALVDRMKVLLLPLITLLIPLARLAPPVYVWRTRSKIYRWYALLREIDGRLRAAAAGPAATPAARAAAATTDAARFADDMATLQQLEQELAAQDVPLSYMQEVYNLRLHADYIRRRVETHLANPAAGTLAAGQPGGGPV